MSQCLADWSLNLTEILQASPVTPSYLCLSTLGPHGSFWYLLGCVLLCWLFTALGQSAAILLRLLRDDTQVWSEPKSEVRFLLPGAKRDTSRPLASQLWTRCTYSLFSVLQVRILRFYMRSTQHTWHADTHLWILPPKGFSGRKTQNRGGKRRKTSHPTLVMSTLCLRYYSLLARSISLMLRDPSLQGWVERKREGGSVWFWRCFRLLSAHSPLINSRLMRIDHLNGENRVKSRCPDPNYSPKENMSVSFSVIKRGQCNRINYWHFTFCFPKANTSWKA